ncbi:MAG: PA14 domain-containing protein, partial [Anaerolineae bacterium]
TQPSEIQVGDLIEVSGQSITKDHIMAHQILILARAIVEQTPTPTKPLSAWRGEYYNNTTFSGAPLVTRSDPMIDFQWQNGSPAEGLPADHFAVRWTGDWPFETGTYRFYAQVDDGVRLWFDDHLMIDQWHESTGALYSADAYVSDGSHAVRVEYFEAWANAHARVWWEYRSRDIAVAHADWKAEYYNNMTLSGTPFLVLNERVIDFDWGAGTPASGMPADHFSVRWTRTVFLDAGTYRFYALSDDGVQLWVDETMVIDHWMDGAAQTYVGDVYLPQGSHTIRVQYYENAGMAVIKVWWELLPATPTPTYTPVPPTSTPLPPTPTSTPLPPTDTPIVPATPQPTPSS